MRDEGLDRKYAPTVFLEDNHLIPFPPLSPFPTPTPPVYPPLHPFFSFFPLPPTTKTTTKSSEPRASIPLPSYTLLHSPFLYISRTHLECHRQTRPPSQPMKPRRSRTQRTHPARRYVTRGPTHVQMYTYTKGNTKKGSQHTSVLQARADVVASTR